MSNASEKKQRLSLDVIGQLEEDLETDPLNYSKWIKLIKQVIAKDKEEQVVSVFNKYLNLFKFDGKQWCNYINYQINRGDFKKVEELFSKCITTIDNVELFRLYVSYVRRVNDVITGGEKARGIVIQAFEFAINRVGIDLKSADLWNDYLDFLKTWTPTASWEQQQKVDLIRKVYKKLLVIPNEKIEQLWSGYTKWENEVNQATASRFIADKSAEFMEARSWNTEWHNITERLLRRELLPLGLNDDTNNIIHRQLDLWYKWLELEKKNNLKIKNELTLKQRIEYVHKQSIISLPFVPELWYRYHKFFLNENEDANVTKSIDLLSRGLIVNPKSFLLSFELTELYEKDNNIDKATEVLQNIINLLTDEYNIVIKHIDSIQERFTDTNNGKPQPNDITTNNNNNNRDNNNDDDDDDDNDKSMNPKFQLSDAEVKTLQHLKAKAKELSRTITLTYTKLMMTCKRSSGIKESRQIFRQAKKFPAIGQELYVENALMEYYSDNRKTASKVFEVGMKSYGMDGKYLISYFDFLILINEIENIKVLFEIAITNLLKDSKLDVSEADDSNAALAPLWEQEEKDAIAKEKQMYIKKLIKTYGKFATKFLDLGIVMSLERRYSEYFPHDDPIDFLRARYAYDEYDLIKKYDLAKNSSNDQEEQEQQDEEPQQKKRKVLLPVKPSVRPTVDDEMDSLVPDNTITPLLQSQQQSQGFIGNSIYNLLRILPNASYFGRPEDHVFNSRKLVELFNSLDNTEN